MFFRLLLLFTLVPLIELAVLVWLGQWVGLLPTIALVFVTGVLGAYLARRQGLITWTRVRAAMARGELPGEALIDALLILIAGAVLLTPGLITDIFGFTLLSPPGRAVVRTRLKRWFERLMASQATQGRVIVVDSRRIDEPDDDVSDNDVS